MVASHIVTALISLFVGMFLTAIVSGNQYERGYKDGKYGYDRNE